MLNLLKSLRRDEYGVILSTEIVIIGTLLVVGLISGIACLQTSVNNELQDLGGAVDALDQSYSFASIRKSGVIGRCCVYTAGSAFHNYEQTLDTCDELVGTIDTVDECVDECVEHSCGHGCASCSRGIAPCDNRASTPCGDCLRRTGGSRDFGFHSRTGGTQSIDTGVRNMKVTEWPGLAQPVPRVTSDGFVPVYPNSHVMPVDPNCCGNPHEGFLQQNPPMIVPPVPEPMSGAPEVPVVPQPELSPMPSTEPLPAPQPEPDRI
jgi:Flp pilus assembly pilin Flp